MNGLGETTMTPKVLTDDTLLVFLSDCHIGGDPGRDIFETPQDLAALFDELNAHVGPVELVLAGDFFDFLRIALVSPGQNRAGLTIARPEYTALFAALRRLRGGPNRTIIYMPGNHDAEVWWNQAIRAELLDQEFVHEFALSYVAAFASAQGQLIYCEHGNQFDSTNTIQNYDDPLDTPLGDHIVTDFMPRLPRGRAMTALHLHDIDRVFPLARIPEWLAGRLFYELATEAMRWVLLPVLVAYAGYQLLAYGLGWWHREIGKLLADTAFGVVILLAGFATAAYLVRRMADRAAEAVPARFKPAASEVPPADGTVERIRELLVDDKPPPMSGGLVTPISVFVSGHTHAPSLTLFGGAMPGVLINSGCWLRQLQPLQTHFGAPTVFASRFVQTHVRVEYRDGSIDATLWERPRPSEPQLQKLEWLAVIGRLPPQPSDEAKPTILARWRSPAPSLIDRANNIPRSSGGAEVPVL
jgi:hypothetical protein